MKLGVVAQPVIPIVRRFRKEDGRFRDSSGYTARLCLKIQKGVGMGKRFVVLTVDLTSLHTAHM